MGKNLNNFWIEQDGTFSSKTCWFARLIRWIQNLLYDKTIRDTWSVFEKTIKQYNDLKGFPVDALDDDIEVSTYKGIIRGRRANLNFAAQMLFSRKNKVDRWFRQHTAERQFIRDHMLKYQSDIEELNNAQSTRGLQSVAMNLEKLYLPGINYANLSKAPQQVKFEITPETDKETYDSLDIGELPKKFEAMLKKEIYDSLDMEELPIKFRTRLKFFRYRFELLELLDLIEKFKEKNPGIDKLPQDLEKRLEFLELYVKLFELEELIKKLKKAKNYTKALGVSLTIRFLLLERNFILDKDEKMFIENIKKLEEKLNIKNVHQKLEERFELLKKELEIEEFPKKLEKRLELLEIYLKLTDYSLNGKHGYIKEKLAKLRRPLKHLTDLNNMCSKVKKRDPKLPGIGPYIWNEYFDQMDMYLKNTLFQFKNNKEVKENTNKQKELLTELAIGADNCAPRWLGELNRNYRSLMLPQMNLAIAKVLEYELRLKEDLIVEICSPYQPLHSINVLNNIRKKYGKELGLDMSRCHLDTLNRSDNNQNEKNIFEPIRRIFLKEWQSKRVISGIKASMEKERNEEGYDPVIGSFILQQVKARGINGQTDALDYVMENFYDEDKITDEGVSFLLQEAEILNKTYRS